MKKYEQTLKQQQEEIRISAECFRTLLEAVPHITWTNKPTGENITFNRTWHEYTGMTVEESVDWGWTSASHPDDIDKLLKDYKDSLKTGNILNAQARVLRNSDQQYRWHLIRGVPIRNEQGEITMWVGTATDIQDQKDAETANIQLRLSQQREILKAILQAQENERAQISEALHNGLSQNLYAVKLHLNSIESDSPQQAQTIEKIDHILDESIKVTRDISFELTPTILKEFGLKTAIKEFVSRICSSKLHIIADIDGCEKRLDHLSELSLYRIIQELLNNVIKHAQATTATVRMRFEDNQVALSVKDNGIGLAQTDIRSLKGIGLHSVRNRVELLGGKLEVKSLEGKGTEFRIYFSF